MQNHGTSGLVSLQGLSWLPGEPPLNDPNWVYAPVPAKKKTTMSIKVRIHDADVMQRPPIKKQDKIRKQNEGTSFCVCVCVFSCMFLVRLVFSFQENFWEARAYDKSNLGINPMHTGISGSQMYLFVQEILELTPPFIPTPPKGGTKPKKEERLWRR